MLKNNNEREAAWKWRGSKGWNFAGCCVKGKWVCLWVLVRIEPSFVCFLRDHSAKNAQKCLEMLINGMQQGNGENARAETLRDVAGRIDDRACEFWWESSYPLYALCATTVLKCTKLLRNADKWDAVRERREIKARVEILKGVAGRVSECACEFWWESSYPLYALCATTVLKMHKIA